MPSEPSPRSDIDAAKEDLTTLGCCVLEGVLSRAHVEQLAARLDALAERDRAAGTAWYSNGNQRLFALVNEDDDFRELAQHPVALEMATFLLGPDRLLSSMTANIALPGNLPQALHTDQQYMTEPWPWPATINVVWMVDAFTRENGATRIIPKTHRTGVGPFSEDLETGSAVGQAGDLLCIDGRLWHGTGVNTSSSPRRGIFSYYCAPFLRQQENASRSFPRAISKDLSPQLRQLLGFDVWLGLGVVNGLPREWMGTGNRSGPTNTDGFFG
jgi:ectoine hydroxylase-related dioxygenase (phytanoyl-CoA dioxygenase family)